MLGLALQSNSSKHLVLILHRQLGNYLLSTRESYSLTVQHIHKTSCKSMFDTYQQGDYLLRHMTTCCTRSWCQSVVLVYVENSVHLECKLWSSHLLAGWTSRKLWPLSCKCCSTLENWRVPRDMCHSHI